MVRKAAIALAAVGLAFAACSTTQSTDTFGPAQPTTIEALDAAVAPAAQAVLDVDAVEITTTWFDGDGEHVRTDWIDWRSDSNFLMVSQFAGPGDNEVDQMASVQLDGNRFCATTGPNMYCDIDDPKINEAWKLQSPVPAESAANRIPISLNLEAMAGAGGSVDEGLPTDARTATKRARRDGTTTWSLHTPFGEGLLTRTWTIGTDGFLASYSAGSESGMPFGLYSRIDFRFLIIDDPTPITEPALDTPLDVGSLGLPGDLSLFDR
ncbi:MAG: hypothetical protein QNL12_00065 [Acidimicrobiia bacterium]|nr:hypothetical protein [Acidimicrobiia bacterium]MDX2465679.1 hypothetical protein [Acidimicrobiia bacterium]